MKVYISGPISNDSSYLIKFRRAETYLKKHGFEVVNPAKILSHFPKNTEYVEYINMSLNLLDKCDVIYMLQDWPDSCGARIEYVYACHKNMSIMYQNINEGA